MDVTQLVSYIKNTECHKRRLVANDLECHSIARKKSKLENASQEESNDLESANPILQLVTLSLHEQVEQIMQMLSEEGFMLHFYVNKMVARILLMEIHARVYYHPEKDDLQGRIPLDLGVLVTLSYVFYGNLEHLKNLPFMDGYSPAELKKCIQRTCQMFVFFLAPEYIK